MASQPVDYQKLYHAKVRECKNIADALNLQSNLFESTQKRLTETQVQNKNLLFQLTEHEGTIIRLSTVNEELLFQNAKLESQLSGCVRNEWSLQNAGLFRAWNDRADQIEDGDADSDSVGDVDCGDEYM